MWAEGRERGWISGEQGGAGNELVCWEKVRAGSWGREAEPGQRAASHPLWAVEAEGHRSSPLSSREITSPHPSIRPSSATPG